MTVNMSRSLCDELGEGTTDGTYKKLPRNRTAVQYPDAATAEAERREMSWRFGFEDAPLQIDPTTGRPARRVPQNHG
jgi:hypothetical protein